MTRAVCLTFVLTVLSGPANAQQQCLHGPHETPEQPARLG